MLQNRGKGNIRMHLLEILLPFLGLLVQYKVSIIPLSVIAMVVIIFFQGKICFRKTCGPYFLYLGYILMRDVFHILFSNYSDVSVQLNIIINYTVQFLLIFTICSNDFDENILYKWWKIAGTIFGIGMVYHVVQIMIFHNPVNPISIIPGYLMRSDALDGSMRPVSFFAEPASYVTSMMPLLFLALKKKDLKWAIISTFLIVISTSTVGVALAAVLWITFIIFEKKNKKITISAIFFIVIFVVSFMNLSVFSDTLSKLQEVSEGGSTWGSRIQGPFEIIGVMKWYELLFGSNFLVVRDFVGAHLSQFSAGSVVLSIYNLGRDFFLNSVASVIYRYGIVGLILILSTFKNKIFNKKYEARMYVIMLLVASVAQGLVFDPNICIMLPLLYANKMNKTIEKNSLNIEV